MAKSKKTGALVALKKILMHNEKDGVCSHYEDQYYKDQCLIDALSFQSPPFEKSSF